MTDYYRFQHERPRAGQRVHCFTSLRALRDFAEMMKAQDPDFGRMKFWKVKGTFVRHDEGDVVVRVSSATRIRL